MKRYLVALLSATALPVVPAHALPDPAAQSVPAIGALAPAALPTAAPSADGPFANATPVSGGELGAVTGQTDLAMVVRAQNTSTVSNNTVSGQSQTGAIRFDAQSLSNLNGLSLLSANTGNNVSINSSLNVNIAIRP
jgi:hypothetical protein